MKTRFDKQFSQKGMIIFSKTKQMKWGANPFLTLLYLKIAFAVLSFSNNINNTYKLQLIFIGNHFIKTVSKEKLKTSEPFGSILWPDLLRYRIFAVVHYGCISDALHIRPQDACNF
jgi:hypothetical protein